VEVGILSGCRILLKWMCAAVKIGLSWFLKTRWRCCRREDWYIRLKTLCVFGFRLVEAGILSACSILLKRMCAVMIGLPEPPGPP